MRIVIVERNRTVVRDHGQDKTLTRRLTAILEHIETRCLELNARLGKIGTVVAIGLVAKVALLDKSTIPPLYFLEPKSLGALSFRGNTELENIAERHAVEIGSVALNA